MTQEINLEPGPVFEESIEHGMLQDNVQPHLRERHPPPMLNGIHVDSSSPVPSSPLTPRPNAKPSAAGSFSKNPKLKMHADPHLLKASLNKANFSMLNSMTLVSLVTWNVLCLAGVMYCLNIMSGKYLELVSVYYQPLLPYIAMTVFWGIIVAYFETCGVRYDVCFKADDQKFLISSRDIFQIAGVLVTLFLTSTALFCYFCAMQNDHLASYQPPLIYCLLAALLLLPVDALCKETRIYFSNTLFRVMTPFREVTWSDFLLADILTSLAKALSDMGRAVCHLATGPVMQVEGQVCEDLTWLIPLGLALPYFWRFCQCIRVYIDTGAVQQLFNALKYSTAFPVIFMIAVQRVVSVTDWLNLYRTWYITAAVVNTVYSYYWDLERDWEISVVTCFKAHRKPRWPVLKSELLYPAGVYYYLMISNLMLRCLWTVRLSTGLWGRYSVVLLCTVLEGFRRFQWTFVRIEVELRKLQHQRPELGRLVPAHPTAA